MSFLSPWVIAAAAGLTLPPLIALYFLKLKRNVLHVPSTLLWRKAIEDLHVNAPFQRLRNSLLLWLQVLLIALGALALGKPMLETAPFHHDALILLIDRSASMGVVEADGKSRLARAKEEARRCVENLTGQGQAMVIAFSDRAGVVSSFDTDKAALRRKIDSIEPSHERTSLREAISLAEAHAQTLIVGGEQVGADVSSDLAAPPAQVYLFTDGRVSDAHQVALERFEAKSITVKRIGARSDNAGILAMSARRHHERPEYLEVTATVGNFADAPLTVDAVLYVEGRNVDVQTISLAAYTSAESEGGAGPSAGPASSSQFTVAFENIEFAGAGVVEVALRVDDALTADDRAWSVIEAPRRLRVLLVEGKPGVLADILSVYPVDVTVMTGTAYESAEDRLLLDGRRSAYDVVIVDRHSTARLPPGAYFFWGATPSIDGVSAGETLINPAVFNWDETHPLLRYVGVETLHVYRALELKLPREAVAIIEGESSPLLAHLSRGSNQYLISAFGLTTESKTGRDVENTVWTVTADFVIFLQNALSFLAGHGGTAGLKSIRPGETASLPVPADAEQLTIVGPDAVEDRVAVAGRETFHYGRTHHVGVFRVRDGVPGNDQFAVNLFDAVESHVRPADAIALSAEPVPVATTETVVNRPAWPYFLLGMLAVLMLEWIVYNRRVFV